MAATGAEYITGLAEFRRDLRAISRTADKTAREAIRRAVDPVREDATRLFAPRSVRSAAGYRVVVRRRGAAVEQRLRRTTGKHPEWGKLQMRTALAPALERNSDQVARAVRGAMTELAERHGF